MQPTVNGGIRARYRVVDPEGRLGKGSGSLQLNTVNGSIHLRKG